MAARLLQKNKLYWPVGGIILILALIVPIVSFAASSPTINEWPTPIAASGPNSIVTGPDGNLWFAQQESNQIGKIKPSSGAITEYNLPAGPPTTYSQNPDGITVGPDGNLWFGIISPVSGPDLLGKMTTTGSLTEYPLSSALVQPTSLISGPDGNIWFAAYSSGYIAAMNTSGTLVHSYPVPNGPEGLSAGPDGNIWFVEQNADKVGKINPNTGAVTTYAVPYLPLDTAVGPDGDIWFTGSYGNYVGKINPSTGAVTTYTVPAPAISPYYGPIYITAGPDGNMWAGLEGYGLARITTSGTVTEYETHNLGSGPTGEAVTSGSDGNLWFTAFDNNAAIGDLVLNTDSGAVAPVITSKDGTSVVAGSQLNFVVTTTGNPTPSISESGSLPNNVTFKDNGNGTGTLAGMVAPTASGTYKVTITASNTAGTASHGFTLMVTVPPNSNSGSTSSESSGNVCPNSTSAEHSASGCSATAPGQATKIDYPATVAPGQTKMVVQSIGSDQTEAVVTTGLDLSTVSYTVPNNQVLYDDGTLGQVVAAPGATVKGTGKIVGSLTIKKGAKLAPGHSPGCLTNGGLTLLGTYQAQIGGTAACSLYDQVTVNGKATIAGTLAVSTVDGYVPSPGQDFAILQVAPRVGNAISGRFLGLPDGATLSSQGVNYRLDYQDTRVVLHVVSVDKDITEASAAAVSTKLVNDIVPRLVSKAIVELALLAAAMFILMLVVVYIEARPKD